MVTPSREEKTGVSNGYRRGKPEILPENRLCLLCPGLVVPCLAGYPPAHFQFWGKEFQCQMVGTALVVARRVTAHYPVPLSLHQMGMETDGHMAENGMDLLLDGRGAMAIKNLKNLRPEAAYGTQAGVIVVHKEVGNLMS
ncbi:MAG: hypothetical protein HY683_01460 [Chloroflexi bacterium]|nr:hypothetical protein [Chloroflexota bacterium]